MKASSLKYSERLALTRVIESISLEILMYSRYKKSSRKYIIEPRKSS